MSCASPRFPEYSTVTAPDSDGDGIPDWWLLDDERVIVLQFTAGGELAERRLIAGPELIAQYREWRDLAVRNATPAEMYAAA